MLQNVSKNYDVKEEKINYREIVNRIFKVQNIIVYILTFMMSMVGFGVDSVVLAPFGIAMLAASISNGLPIACVYIASLLGTAIRFGGASTVSFIFSSIIMLLLVLIKKPARNEDENEKIRLGSYLFISVIIVQAFNIIFKGFYFYDLLLTITMGVSSYIFYKIFVNSIDVISKYGIKKIFSIEEVIGASLIFAIASIALSNIHIFSFSLRNIICIFIVLLLGWRNGILVGGISGITIGIVLGIIGDGNPILIATYAISGMLSGLLNRFGKIGVIIGFILGNVLIAYSANGGVANIIVYQEILIASIGLLAMPKNTKININEIIPQTKMLPEAGRTLEASDETLVKLNSISKTISDIADNYKEDELYDKNETSFEEEIIKAIDGMEDNLLYDYIYNNEDNVLRDIFEYLIENGILTQNAIISIFTNHNIYLMNSDNNDEKNAEEKEIREILNAVNSAWRICKSNIIWQKKFDEANKNMSDQLKTVKSAIENITEDFVETENDTFKEQKQQIIKSLKDKNIYLSDIKIKKEPSNRLIINTYTKLCDDETGNLCPIKQIARTISSVFNEKFTVQDQKCGIRLNKDMCSYTYLSDDKYLLQTGIAKCKKDGVTTSGDSISSVRLGDGKYLFAISDGMGSGDEARKNSTLAISMLERLLSSGFEKDTSLKLINSALLSANKKESYATLDIGILDLYAGTIELIKSGACPTYFKRNKNVSIIKSNSLPTGIVNDTKVDTYDKDLEDGDIIVLCSDGILDSSIEYANKDLWLKYLLEDIQTDVPERIADIILRESKDNCMGKPKDDMSIIVIKVIKK